MKLVFHIVRYPITLLVQVVDTVARGIYRMRQPKPLGAGRPR